MSSEPERDIEKQIRNYAEKRRAESVDRFAMHPATRQNLHGEVADAFPRETPDPTPITVLHAEETVGIWTLFKRQFAVICALAVVLTGFGYAWIHYGNRADVEVAEANATSPTQDVVDEVPAPMEVVNLDEGAVTPPEPASTPETPETAAAAAPPPLASLVEPASDGTSATPAAAQVATETARAEPPAPTPPPAAAPLTATDPSRPSQRFVNAASPRRYRRNFNSPAPVDFLTSFQVQQVGRQLLLVDADGSTFSGQIDPPDHEADSLQFRVSGSSGALNRHVTITGRLSPAGATTADAARPVNLRVASESRLPLDRLRIDARAIIGEESRPITATPVSGQ